MIAAIGYYSLFIGLALSLTQFLAPLIFKLKSSRVIETIAFLTFWSIVTAFVALVYSFAISDFSVVNVTLNSQQATPLIYKIAGAWASHEGSMLMWVLLLSAFNFAYIFSNNKDKIAVHGIFGFLIFLFLAFVVFMSNPLVQLPSTPIQGLGLNPLLEDPLLAIHPPILYAGYLGFSICFAKAFAGIQAGTINKNWAAQCQPWALVSWALLTVGLILGSIWAYYELGWGGWWFWDPVENAALIPWLAATALIHSLAATKTENKQRIMTVCLSFLTFILAVVGTFLVRSGVLTSVHSFASDPTRGYVIFAIAMIVMGIFIYSLVKYLKTYKSDAKYEFLSRSGFIFINNIILLSILVIVLLGTIYPLLVDFFIQKQMSINEPYFNTTVVPFILLLTIFMGVSHFLSWNKIDFIKLNKAISPYLAISFIAFLVFTYGYSMLAIGFGVWVILTSLRNVRTQASMSLAHLGVGIAILGATINAHWKQEEIATFKIGETKTIANQLITLKDIKVMDAPYFKREQATILVNGNQSFPERRYYPLREALTTETSIIRSGLSNVYIAIGEFLGNNTWQLRIYYHPYIILIWLGGFVSVFGALLGLKRRFNTSS